MRKTSQIALRFRIQGIVRRIALTGLALGSIAVATTGCRGASPAAPSAGPGRLASTNAATEELNAEALRQIAQLRALMAPFHNPTLAAAAGYDIPVGCVSDPARGGMGYHYMSSKKDLILDGVVNLLEPEFIVFSPEKNGGLRLSAADYFVPYGTWSSAQPPSLLGVPFHREDEFQAWVLHIWAFWPNPAGIFENFNPDVPLCP